MSEENEEMKKLPIQSLSEAYKKGIIDEENWSPVVELSELRSSEIDEVLNDNKDKFINVWDIIDTYFRDTLYYKSQHQVDSYNEFIFSDKNGIKNIIRGENPFIIKKGENSRGNFNYEIKIYFGETIDTHGNIIQGIDNFFISSPTIEDENGNHKYLYPNEARLRGLTYIHLIYFVILVLFIIIIIQIEKI